MKKYLPSYILLIGLAGLIVALDQWTKYLVRTGIPMGESITPFPWAEGLISLIHTQNTGAAFSMGQGMGPVFTGLAVVVTGVILYAFPRIPTNEKLVRASLIFLMGGALGNLVDRLTIGQVTDFLYIHYFAVINLADACITTGAGLLILSELIKTVRKSG